MASTIRYIPFNRIATVASAGLVGFLALWQGIFSFVAYHPCAVSNPSFVIPSNIKAGAAELTISVVALFILFSGARKLRTNFQNAEFFGYALVVTSLLIGEGLLSFIFIYFLSTCAG